MPSSTYEERVAFGKLPEEQREELFRKMTPEERSDISGYGTEDAPGYCDMNGHCYSCEDDAECADSYIKEIEELREQLEDDTRQVHQLFAENEKLKAEKEESESESEEVEEVEETEEMKKLLKENEELKKKILAQ